MLYKSVSNIICLILQPNNALTHSECHIDNVE